MEKIGVSELRANLTTFLKKAEAGQIISITVRGSEIARLVPPEHTLESARHALAELRKTAYVGDVLSPIDETWEAAA